MLTREPRHGVFWNNERTGQETRAVSVEQSAESAAEVSMSCSLSAAMHCVCTGLGGLLKKGKPLPNVLSVTFHYNNIKCNVNEYKTK